MLEALLLGVATALPLALGAVLGVVWTVPKPVLAVVLAFGAGTLIASVSDGLFAPAFKEVGGLAAAVALLLGTATFVIASRALATSPASLVHAMGRAHRRFRRAVRDRHVDRSGHGSVPAAR